MLPPLTWELPFTAIPVLCAPAHACASSVRAGTGASRAAALPHQRLDLLDRDRFLRGALQLGVVERGRSISEVA